MRRGNLRATKPQSFTEWYVRDLKRQSEPEKTNATYVCIGVCVLMMGYVRSKSL
jgi:hypothetical protein